jgi:hypothetical protein
VTLLESRVVRRGDAGQYRELLAAKAWDPPAGSGREADILWTQRRSPGPKELAQGTGRRHDVIVHRRMSSSVSLRVPASAELWILVALARIVVVWNIDDLALPDCTCRF